MSGIPLTEYLFWLATEKVASPCSGHANESETEELKEKYGCLADVLNEAFRQAAVGKGAQRHASGKPFDEQPMQKLCELYGVGFALGQAAKKMQESTRMETDRAVHELLGAINYIAGAIIHLRKVDENWPATTLKTEEK